MIDTEETNLIVAKGNTLKLYGSDEVVIYTGKHNHEITRQNVLFVPEIEFNLFSVSRATNNGCQVTFEKNKCDITCKGETILQGKLKNNLYEVYVTSNNKNNNYSNRVYNCTNVGIGIWDTEIMKS